MELTKRTILKITSLSISISISILMLSACGGKRDGSKEDPKISQYQTSGSCPSEMVNGLSLANTYVRLFELVGPSQGKNLADAHEAYDTALSYFKVLSCEAVDSERGSIVSMNKTYIDVHIERIYKMMSTARVNTCRKSDLLVEEKKGCAYIESYMKRRFGN